MRTRGVIDSVAYVVVSEPVQSSPAGSLEVPYDEVYQRSLGGK